MLCIGFGVDRCYARALRAAVSRLTYAGIAVTTENIDTASEFRAAQLVSSVPQTAAIGSITIA